VDEIGKNYRVRVVTSDNLIRLSALRSGVLRTGSKEFAAEVEDVLRQIDELLKKSNEKAHSTTVSEARDAAK
jgi:predicted RNA-binding protein with PIN domain